MILKQHGCNEYDVVEYDAVQQDQNDMVASNTNSLQWSHYCQDTSFQIRGSYDQIT